MLTTIKPCNTLKYLEQFNSTTTLIWYFQEQAGEFFSDLLETNQTGCL